MIPVVIAGKAALFHDHSFSMTAQLSWRNPQRERNNDPYYQIAGKHKEGKGNRATLNSRPL